ncbi:hypothetical protein [Streptomyces arenae]|uniref:hypothetical protein n=1 Tax=Streptomyces arenae TaxID=29301 RepID=UPI002657B532|nr:hypothetical protein [Streptomyces arenae]MCG7206397.1 hypothetical protein [Streptomyces arenae]
MADRHEQWLARSIRTCAQVPRDVPLSWMAEKLIGHARRLEHSHGQADAVGDALAMLALSAEIGTKARWGGVRQALRAGARVPEVARALGISIEDARRLARLTAERARFLGECVQQMTRLNEP